MASAHDHAASEGTVRADDASIRWRRDGTGPALVLLHGFPLSGRTWDGVVARLRDRFTCWTLDLVGLGGSTSTAAADHSSQGQALALKATLTHLGVASYALLGNDTGGWIARELALVDAPRVTRLVLTNTEIPFHRPPWIPTYQALAHEPGFGTVLQRLLEIRALRRSPLVFGGCFHDLAHLDGPFHARHVELLVRSSARMEGALEFLRRMKFARLDEFSQLHAEITIPTLFVWGADDPAFPLARAREMARQLPNVAGFHEVKDAKLFFYEEQPEALARAVGRFLG
jgi:pimeloyl-ACP methyl ester carboxylesterase